MEHHGTVPSTVDVNPAPVKWTFVCWFTYTSSSQVQDFVNQQELYVIFFNGIPPLNLSDAPICFLPFAFRLCVGFNYSNSSFCTTSRFQLAPTWVDDFPNFPRWDMLVPWRVSLLILKHLFIARWHTAPAASDSLSLSLSLSPSLCVSIFTNAQTHNLHVCIYIY